MYQFFKFFWGYCLYRPYRRNPVVPYFLHTAGAFMFVGLAPQPIRSDLMEHDVATNLRCYVEASANVYDMVAAPQSF